MPKKRKQKLAGSSRKRKVYSQTAVYEALRRIDLGEVSIRQAAREYGIPRTTLGDKVGGKSPVEAKRGANPYMSSEEEERLADWAINMKSTGQKCTMRDIQEMAQQMLEADGRDTQFKDNKPGDGWARLFLTRNPRVAAFFVRQNKIVVTTEVVDKWFVDLKEFLQEKNCLSIPEFPDRMWHFDEQPFGIWKDGHKVQGFRIKKSSSKPSDQAKKRQVTTLLGMSASGHYCPPLISYPGTHLPEGLSQPSGPHMCFMGSSQNGGIDAELFLSWLREHFLPFLINRDIHFPVLVFVDGRSTYINEEVEKFCTSKFIVLYRLPTESSQAVNPMELAVRGELKKVYLQAERSWRGEHPCQTFCTQSFHDVLLDTWAAISRKPELAQIGFWCTGLSPFDGKYNKDKDTHPFFQEEVQETSNVVVPTSSSGTSNPTPTPGESFVGSVEVSIAPEDHDILELLAASQSCEVIMDERTPVTSEVVVASRSQSITAQNIKSAGKPQTQRTERSAKRLWKNGQRWNASRSNLKVTSITKKRKVEEDLDAILPSKPLPQKRQSQQTDNERPGNELQQMRFAIRDARVAMRESERAAREAIADVKEIKQELKVAEVVERDARKELRKAKKVLKEAENVLKQYRLREKNAQEKASPSMRVDDDINDKACPVCGVTYEDCDGDDQLVSCTNCPRRYHIMCTDLFCVPDEKIPHIQYRCPFCAYL